MRIAVLVLVLAACADRGVGHLPGIEHDRVQAFDVPVAVPEKHDLLFVIDDSTAMAPFAELLASELPRLVDRLADFRITDLHFGMVAASDGAFRHDGLVGSPFLIDWRHLDGTRSANYSGELADQILRLAPGSHAGSSTRPLAAIRAALSTPGFRRDDSTLLVIMITASDDPSTTSLDDDIALLRPLGDRSRTLLSVIGPRPAPRLEALLAAFPNRAWHRSIEAPGYDDALSGLSTLGCYRGGDPCLVGEPLECAFSDVLVEDGIPVYEEIVPACDDDPAARPCWRIARNDTNCPVTGLEVEVMRRDYPRADTHVIGNCSLE